MTFTKEIADQLKDQEKMTVAILILLRKYIEHVSVCEGIDFLNHDTRKLSPLSEKDFKQLRRIRDYVLLSELPKD
jgi:hypothetical protein